MISVHFILIFFWITQEFVSCVNTKMSADYLTAALGDSLTLNCTYNCSTGFVRGCWHKASDKSGCLGTYSKSSVCTTSLHLSNVTAEDLNTTYTCYTEDKDDPRLPQKTQRVVVLQLQAQTSAPNWTITEKTETTNASLPAPNDSNAGEFTGIKVLATVTVAVATVLAALAVYLCLSRNRRSWNGESVESRSCSPLPSHAVLSPGKGSMSIQSERVTLRIPTPDNESDTEVPYADIMITVRGVSTPELTQVGYSTPADKKEWWGDGSRSHLQACRSADRLHVPMPREVSRKMSTSSEYAVITYA
ncbi:uncharacterized protein LOC113173882 isoform X2 [Anabas testudineus]|uniref:uncharacterized protein LOC113173882 isoform X2 n=1 Tax=Anabas testudineus TaxID=64144 RepID=UPI000E453EBC|nr:uncharacterized protein LOC113173882 isoform X2 [Anabas testudineus]